LEKTMSFLSNLGSLFSEQDAQRIASGQGDYQSPDSSDSQRVASMVSKAQPQQLQQVFKNAAQQMDSQEYADHITPGAGGTNPLGDAGAGGLGAIASALMQQLKAAGPSATPPSQIPGVQASDPSQMTPDQVAALAKYMQQNHPDAFGGAAAQIGQQQPALLHSFLGRAGLAIGAAALASRFMRHQQQ
jgi:hypothetical protein